MDSGISAGMKDPRSAPTDDRTPPRTRQEPAGDEYYGRTPAKRTVDIDAIAPTMGALYGVEQLRANAQRELLSLATLPGPEEMPNGFGMGEAFNNAIGGGVEPGYLMGIAAPRAGGGKTAFAMQLADGLALRNVTAPSDAPLTPVLVATEMRPDALTWRSLARWTRLSVATYRAGKSAEKAEEALEQGELAFGGEYGKSRAWMRLYKGDGGNEFFENVPRVLDAWRESLELEHKRPVWPVLVVDPLHRFAGAGPEIEAVNAFVDKLGALVRSVGAICLATCDTTKSAATGGDKGKGAVEEGAAAFRGTYRLQHLFDAALFLSRDKGTDTVETVLIKNRNGPEGESAGSFQFVGSKMRYMPQGDTKSEGAGAGYDWSKKL